MSDIAIDYPDEVITWFESYSEAERGRVVSGKCPHDCPHNMTAVVGWGPDYQRYELCICTVREGCDGNCRGWMGGTGATSYELHRRINWKLLSALEG